MAASPFPGMDPYLEQHWSDVHTRMVIYASDQLQKVLPRDLRARVEERLAVTGSVQPRSIFPDVRVVEGRRPQTSSAAVAVAMAEPIVIFPDEPETQRFIEIREESPGDRLVTVIEVLSPSNKKPGDAQEQYLRKQQEVLHGGISLVEIDLLRQGEWVLAVLLGLIDAAARTPFRVVVCRGWQFFRAEYYPIA